jgi:hypothetical protein
MANGGGRALFGFAAVVIALLGVALIVAQPAFADPPEQCPAGESNGLLTNNLGV